LDDFLLLDKRDHSAEAIAAIKEVATKSAARQIDVVAVEVASDLVEEQMLDHRYRTTWVTWPDGDGWTIHSDPGESLEGIKRLPKAAIILNISAIQRELWGIKLPGRDS
jgi:hypothetical protein